MTRISAIVLRWHNSPYVAQKIEREALAAGWVGPEEVAAREQAARREALLEAATKCDCAALLIETNSHEEHCAIYRDPERERDEAVAALRRVETLAEDFRKSGFTSVYESALEIAELIDRALAEPERDGEPCSCGSRDATSLTPGEWLHHSPDGCTIERDEEGES